MKRLFIDWTIALNSDRRVIHIAEIAQAECEMQSGIAMTKDIRERFAYPNDIKKN